MTSFVAGAATAPVSALQREGWERLMYAKAVLVYLVAKEPFWERDGMPPWTYSDQVPELCSVMRPLATAPTASNTETMSRRLAPG